MAGDKTKEEAVTWYKVLTLMGSSIVLCITVSVGLWSYHDGKPKHEGAPHLREFDRLIDQVEIYHEEDKESDIEIRKDIKGIESMIMRALPRINKSDSVESLANSEHKPKPRQTR